MFGNNDNNTVGMFDFAKPSKRKAPKPTGRKAGSRRDMGKAFAEIEMIMREKMTVLNSGYGQLTGIHVSDSRTSTFVRFLSFAQAVGFNAGSESECQSAMQKIASAAQRNIKADPNFMFKGIYIFTKIDDFVNYFLLPVAVGVFRNKTTVKTGRMEVFAADLVAFIKAYGTKGYSRNPSKGFNSYDWAIIAAGVTAASQHTAEASAHAADYQQFPVLAGGYVNFAMQAGSVKSYRSVRSRVDLEFAQIRSLSDLTQPKIAKYGANKEKQKQYLNALGRACSIMADRASAAGIKASLAIAVVKSGGLKSLVGDLYLMKSINGYFGGLSGAAAVEYGKDKNTLSGKAIVNGNNFQNAIGGSQLAKLSIRSMAGRIFILGLIRYMIGQINANPSEFIQYTGRQPQEIIAQLNKMEGSVSSFRKLGKGVIFYIKLEGAFASMLQSSAGDAELKMLSSLVGSKTGVGAGPAIKYTDAAIFGKAGKGVLSGLGTVDGGGDDFFASKSTSRSKKRRY